MKKTYNTPLPCHELTDKIIRAYYQVLNEFTHIKGVPESAFREYLATVLRGDGLFVETEKIIPMIKNGRSLARLRTSLVVERLVVVELKNLERVTKKHFDQGTLYLDYGGYPAGLILNYGVKNSKPQRIPPPAHYHREVKKCPGS